MEEYRAAEAGGADPQEILIAGHKHLQRRSCHLHRIRRGRSAGFSTGHPLVAVSAPASVTATAAATSAAATTVRAVWTLPKRQQWQLSTINRHCCCLEAKATVGGAGLSQAAAVVPTLSPWDALAA